MKKYPSYTTINNLQSCKKLSLIAKYQKPNTTMETVKNSSRSHIQHVGHKSTLILNDKKQSITNYTLKKPSDFQKKESFVQKSKTEANQNKASTIDNKHDYEALKNRLHALEDRLVEIKKSYEIRKNKSQHFSIERSGAVKSFINKENPQTEREGPRKKKQLNIKTNPNVNGIQHKNLDRLTVQSPKIGPLQEKTNQFKQTFESKKQRSSTPQNNQTILSQYVTQYEQKPIAFKHTTSQTNLFRPLCKDKVNQSSKKEKKNEEIYYISSLIRAIEAAKPSSFDQLCASHLLASYEFLCYVKNAGIQKPPKPTIKSLPPSTKKHTIIFDLDETLIHCVQSKKSGTADITLPVLFPDRKEVIVGINIRPYTIQCLKQLSKYFEIMVFTASHANYASTIVDYLDPERQFISHKFSRESCYKTQQGFYVKDLRVVDRKLSNILLIDNAAYSYCFQPENGVPIVPYYDNKADLELKNLIPYLRSFLNEADVRVRNSEIMKLGEYTKYRGPEELINKLYK